MIKSHTQTDNEINKNEREIEKSCNYRISEEIIYQIRELALNGVADEIIGSLEYLIKKATRHPNQMKEVDFTAAKNGLILISFIQLIKTHTYITPINS